MSKKKFFSLGQSLLELIVAIAIFVVAVTSMSFLIMDSYLAGRFAYEFTRADFLAKEGIEALISIRNNSWDDLSPGNHGLAIEDSKWILSGESQDLGDILRNGTRIIKIEDIGEDRRKVFSKISWLSLNQREEEVEIISYLTNWQKEEAVEIRRPIGFSDSPPRQTSNPELAFDSDNGNTFSSTNYNRTKDPSILFFSWEESQVQYSELTLNFRYHADGDSTGRSQYAVAFSLSGCQETEEGGADFIDIIPLTSNEALDTTIPPVNLSPDQDLSQLCVKIYTNGNPPARENIYIRDIWTEGKI